MKTTCHHMLISGLMISLLCIVNIVTSTDVPIGVILDMDTSFGKMTSTCISMAISDFYRKRNGSTTFIRPHFRDSKQNNVQAASAAIDLLKNVQVLAILGPTKSAQAAFVIDVGNNSKVPIISPATSPSLSPNDNVYFIRAAHSATSQLKPIAEMVAHFNWKELVFVSEDDEYGRGLVPYFSDAMTNVGAKVISHTVIRPSASDDWIRAELYKLKTMQTRVFIVHALPDLASRFFKIVNEAEMMDEGYVWIITEVLTSRLHSLDRKYMDSMQGVLGVKSYIPRSNELIDFEKRWKREFLRRNPKTDVTELDMFGIWSYDSVFALATALEKVGNGVNMTFQRESASSSDLVAIGTSEMGSSLVQFIRNSRFKGLSGDFHVVDGQLQSSVYEIVNIIGNGEKPIGVWSPENGITKTLDNDTKGLKAVTWPGDSHVVPQGWEMPTSNDRKLRVGIPAKNGKRQFIDANTDPRTKQVVVTGFCKDVFDAVVGALPYAVKHEFIPFVTPDGEEPAGTYNDLLRNLSVGKYDWVAGDITILADRSSYVDFTLPFSEGGVTMVVPIQDERKSAWIFLRPLEKELWLTIAGFFIYTGIVVWVLEHHVNKEFRGPPGHQVGMIFWFSFSTLVFAHRERLISNLARFVITVWVFVVLVLTSSYTASLTSMLTVEQLQPINTDINDILKNGESVGYQDGSFVGDMLKKMGFHNSRLKEYKTIEDYNTALKLGSQNGGVSAIMDELPYVRLFLAKYCTKYMMTGPSYKTAGLGFAFPRGSPMVRDVSRAILQVTEEQMLNISNQWFGEVPSCNEQSGTSINADRLNLDNFRGLFLIAGLSSTSALLIFFFRFLHQNREILMSQDSLYQKCAAMVKTFNVFKEDESRKAHVKEVAEGSSNIKNPAISLFHQEEGMFSLDEGFTTTEPEAPLQDKISIVKSLTGARLGTNFRRSPKRQFQAHL